MLPEMGFCTQVQSFSALFAAHPVVVPFQTSWQFVTSLVVGEFLLSKSVVLAALVHAYMMSVVAAVACSPPAA